MHSVRYAHCDGFTEICAVADKGSQFITCGEDGEVRVWQNFDDVDNRSIQVGEKCFGLAYADGKIFVSDEQNEVKRYDYETGECQGVVASFSMQVTCMSVNKSATQLLCGSADFQVQLVDLTTLKCIKFSGHEAPILSLVFDPFQKYFISSSCDATARVWSVANSNTVKVFDHLHAKTNDFIDSESLCKVAWHKDGGLIAVPTKNDVNFYERESWIFKFKINLKNENNPGEELLASILSFSPDGKHILVATSVQIIFVHSIINKSQVFKYVYNKKNRICSLIWHPNSSNEVLFCDINGQMGQIKLSFKTSNDIEPVTKVKESTTNKAKSEELELDDLMELLGDDDCSNSNQESTKLASKKNKLGPSPKKRKRLSDEDDDNDDENTRDSDSKSSKNKSEEAAESDEQEDDIESIEKLKERAYKLAKKEILIDDDEGKQNELNSGKKAAVVPEVVQQKPFQPSSTPLNLSERYMVWNSVGLITQFSRDEDDSIDMEFHNASHHHTIHLKNQFGYTMADMSKDVVVLASPGSVDADTDDLNDVLAQSVQCTSRSKLTAIMLNALDASSKEWQIDMPKKESIRCVCASRRLIACATSRKFLRVFYLSGVQREIFALNGSPICLAAYNDKLFVCYNCNNSIGYSIYCLKNEPSRVQSEHGMLPLSGSESQLSWIGFSEEGNPYFLDTNGYLFLKPASGVWAPLSFLRQTLNHKTDHYWLVGISERSQMIKAILCRASRYPSVLPRPNLTTLSVCLPLCDLESEKSKLEQDYWTNLYLAANLKSYDCESENVEGLDEDELEEKVDRFETSAREALMKLFMLACRSGKEQRAFDVATIMDIETIQLAIKFATKLRALGLAHNLNNLAEKKAREPKETDVAESYVNPSLHQVRSMGRPSIEDTSDIIVESSIQASSNQSFGSKSMAESRTQDSEASQLLDSSIRTPTMVPLTNTRINPFASKSAKVASVLGSGESANNENCTPKSVLNLIEDKLIKKNSLSAKERDSWKPTPARKLVKSKVSTGTPTLGSFFNN